jgi:hypothetical protein
MYSVESQQITCYLLYAGFFLVYSSTLKMKATFPPKRQLTFNGLHDVTSISQKIELLITTAVLTSNPTSVRIRPASHDRRFTLRFIDTATEQSG